MRLSARKSLTSLVFVPWPAQTVVSVSLSNSLFEMVIHCSRYSAGAPTVQPAGLNYERESIWVMSLRAEGS